MSVSAFIISLENFLQRLVATYARPDSPSSLELSIVLVHEQAASSRWEFLVLFGEQVINADQEQPSLGLACYFESLVLVVIEGDRALTG